MSSDGTQGEVVGFAQFRGWKFYKEFPDGFSIFEGLVTNKGIGRIYQVVVAQHEDTPNPHLHVVFNAVSYINGYKYHGSKEDYYELIDSMSSIIQSSHIQIFR